MSKRGLGLRKDMDNKEPNIKKVPAQKGPLYYNYSNISSWHSTNGCNNKGISCYKDISLYIPTQTKPLLKRIIKIISIALVLTFSWQQVTWAQGGMNLLGASKTPKPPIEAGPQYMQKDDEVVIPKELGITQSKTTGTEEEIVINIQDAHDSIPAQYSIVNILDNLNRNYKLELISIEGSSGLVDTSLLRSFPEDTIKEKVARSLMKEGKLQAAEYYSVTSKDPVLLYGIENSSLYTQNVSLFQSNLKGLKKSLTHTESLIKALSSLEHNIYNKDVRELINNSELYKDSKLSFNEYWNYLTKLTSAVDATTHTNLSKLVRTMEIEATIDFDKTNIERELLITNLKNELTKRELKNLILKALSFKQHKITPREFYNYLGKLAEKHNVSTSEYTNLNSYTEYVTLYETIDIISLHHEIGVFEEELITSTLTTDQEKTLYTLTKEAKILKELFQMDLTNGRLDYLLNNFENITADKFTSFLSKHNINLEINELFDSLSESVKFYQVALKRDKAIAKNTVSNMREKNRRITALVTGGFHTKGITEFLAKDNVSTLVVLPQFDAEGEKRPYATVLTRKGKAQTEQLGYPSYHNPSFYTREEQLNFMKFEIIAPNIAASLFEELGSRG